MTLATSSPEGLPHAAPVYFAALPTQAGEAQERSRAPFHLYFFSEADSRHSLAIDRLGMAAGAIYPPSQDWREIRGLQLLGKARMIAKGAEWETAWKGYKQKFPFVAALKPVIARNALYALTPIWLRLVDNSVSFGFKQEWSFSE